MLGHHRGVGDVASSANSARKMARTQSSPQPSSSATRATRLASTECRGNRLGCRKASAEAGRPTGDVAPHPAALGREEVER